MGSYSILWTEIIDKLYQILYYTSLIFSVSLAFAQHTFHFFEVKYMIKQVCLRCFMDLIQVPRIRKLLTGP